MITVDRPAFYPNKRYTEWCGLSTDDRGALTPRNGDKFYEINTGKSYKFNADTDKWVEQTHSGGSGGGSVTSVNGSTGDVTLTAVDVGALPNTTLIPAKTSELTNDSGYITNAALSGYAKTTAIPTKTSQLSNDSGFITTTALDGYAKESEIPSVPTKTSELNNDSGFITNTADASMNNYKITNLADPTSDQDAVTVAYLTKIVSAQNTVISGLQTTIDGLTSRIEALESSGG